MDNIDFKKVAIIAVLTILSILSFFLLKPILLSIITGLLLAFVFSPIYDMLYKRIHSKNISALIICGGILLILFLPLWFLTPIILDQSFKIFQLSQQIDFVAPLQKLFPSFFASEQTANEIGSILHSFVTKTTNSITNSIGNLILNFSTLFLQMTVVIFTFFFLLRDKDLFVAYIRSITPFSKDIEKQIFDSSRDITYSVLYGQVIIGLIQGFIVGLGFLILGIQNALFLTILACLAGIFPIIGTTIVWLPIAIYLFITGDTFSAVGITIFGLVSNIIDNILRPIIVSKRTRMHPALVLIGMIGGLFLFGILGFILGPLILAYFFIILDIYRNKHSPGVFGSKDNESGNFIVNLLR
jgi:predicted PurR-regulated permease PerM